MMTKEKRQAVKEQIDFMVSLVPGGEVCAFPPMLVTCMSEFSNYDERNKLWTVDDGTKSIKVISR